MQFQTLTHLIKKDGAVNSCSPEQVLFSSGMELEVWSNIVDFACAKKESDKKSEKFGHNFAKKRVKWKKFVHNNLFCKAKCWKCTLVPLRRSYKLCSATPGTRARSSQEY